MNACFPLGLGTWYQGPHELVQQTSGFIYRTQERGLKQLSLLAIVSANIAHPIYKNCQPDMKLANLSLTLIESGEKQIDPQKYV